MNQQSATAGGPPAPEPRTPAPYGTVTAAAERARELVERMRASLAAVGFDVERDFPNLRGDTTVADEPFLTFGRLTPDVTELLAAALSRIPILV